MSQSKISKLERRLLRPAPDDVRTLCEVYGATDDQRDELVGAAATLRTDMITPTRVTLSRGAQHMQQRIRHLEASVTLLRGFQNAMVIGLLQTRDYASLVFGASVPEAEAGEAVAARLQRQSQLERIPRAVLIMTEGALTWPLGGPRVMAPQVEAISGSIGLPNVEIGIIPRTADVRFNVRHGFHLYDSDAVIWGSESGTATITSGEDIARYEKFFDRITAAALMGDAARPVLDRIASEYRAML